MWKYQFYGFAQEIYGSVLNPWNALKKTVHMNQIENLWRDAKRKLNAVNGVQHTYLPANLDEWMWRHKRDKDHYFHNLLSLRLLLKIRNTKCDSAVLLASTNNCQPCRDTSNWTARGRGEADMCSLCKWSICLSGQFAKNVINVYICLRCFFEPFNLCGTSKLGWFWTVICFDYSSFDDCNLLGSMEEVNFLKIIMCAF